MTQTTNQPHDSQPTIQERLQELADFLSHRPSPVPPDVQTRLMAQLAQRHSQATEQIALQNTLRAWLVPAMTGLLVLSLGANTWLGFQHHVLNTESAPQIDTRIVAILSQSGSTYQFQKYLKHPDTWNAYLTAYADSGGEPTVIHGFEAPTEISVSVRIGSLYAEALAALHSGAYEATAARVEELIEALHQMKASDVLILHLRDVEWQIEKSPDTSEMAEALALFEPLYEAVYTSSLPGAIHSFRVGSGLTNLALAAALGDAGAVLRGVQDIEQAMSSLSPPNAVLSVLAQLQTLVTDRALSAHDMPKLHTLIQTLRKMLQTT